MGDCGWGDVMPNRECLGLNTLLPGEEERTAEHSCGFVRPKRPELHLLLQLGVPALNWSHAVLLRDSLLQLLLSLQLASARSRLLVEARTRPTTYHQIHAPTINK